MQAKLKGLVHYLPPIAVLVFAGTIMVWTYDYQPLMRQVPLLAAWATIVLATIDLLGRTDTSLGRLVQTLTAWKSTLPGLENGTVGVALRTEVAAVLWIVGFVIGVVVLGFYVAIPIYVFLATLVQARKGVLISLLSAVGMLLAIWLLFAVLLSYAIYGGLLFE